MDYKQKYIKYKEKYLKLKYQISMHGGDLRKIKLNEAITEALMINNNNIPKSYLVGSLFLKKLGIIKPFNSDTSIYTMLGHGCDNPGSVEIMPKNCTYVHQAQCGYLGYSDKWEKLHCLIAINSDLLKNPIANKIELANLGIDYTLDKEGGTYVNNRFNSYLLPMMGLHSGLHQISHNIGMFDSDNECLKNTVKYEVKDLLDPNLFIKFLTKQYEYSLFPTMNDITYVLELEFEKFKELHSKLFDKKDELLSNLDSSDRKVKVDTIVMIKNKSINLEQFFKEIVDKYFKVDIKTLFEFFPGVYYSISCRFPCDLEIPEDINIHDHEAIVNFVEEKDTKDYKGFFQLRRSLSSRND